MKIIDPIQISCHFKLVQQKSCWSQTPERGVSRLGEAYERRLWRSQQETAQESAKASLFYSD